jgi:hypothetical protein
LKRAQQSITFRCVLIRAEPDLLCSTDDFRSVLEMHRVVVVPLAAPNKTMLLKNVHDLPRNLIFVRDPALGARLGPQPVVGSRCRDVDRDPVTVRTEAVGTSDRPVARLSLSRCSI